MIEEPPKIPWYRISNFLLNSLRNPVTAVNNIVSTYGDIIAFKIGNMRSIIFLNHPDYIKHILKDNVDNYSRGRAFHESATGLEEILGNGIFMSEGSDWEIQHKILKALFTPTAIQQTKGLLEEEVYLMVNEWASKLPNNSIYIESEMNMILLRIFLRSHVSKDYHFDFDKIYKIHSECIEATSRNNSIKFELKAFFLNLIGIKYRQKKVYSKMPELYSFADLLISQLLERKYVPVGLFKLMLEEYDAGNVSVKDIRDQFFSFLFAGFETTSTAIAFLLYNLAVDASLQKRVQDEIDNVNASDGSVVNKQRLLQLAIKESLRLYSPIWTTGRVALKDDVIGGYLIKAKSTILISSHALHRHKAFWPSGDTFNITNFEKDNFKGKAFAYIPYGQGKRSCIGMALADYQIQFIATALLKAFTFETASNKKPGINANIIIKASPSLKLKINKRVPHELF